jgi:hypothetical protein
VIVSVIEPSPIAAVPGSFAQTSTLASLGGVTAPTFDLKVPFHVAPSPAAEPAGAPLAEPAALADADTCAEADPLGAAFALLVALAVDAPLG